MYLLFYLFRLIRLVRNRWILVRRGRLGMLRYRRDGGCSRAARGQFRRPVLWSADVSMNEVLADLVHHHLHRLRFILRVDPDRLVEIHSLLAELIVLNDHLHVIIHVLCIGPAPGQWERAESPELLRLGMIECELVLVC